LPPCRRRYWYPLSYCISLALQPAALIGLNSDLRLPAFSVRGLRS
jgi:hypothetical protein